MPTGYTAGIEDGKITTLKQYALVCARAFGALIHMREDSLQAEITLPEVDRYYPDAIERTTKELAEWKNMSEAKRRAMWEQEWEDYLSYRRKSNEKDERTKKLYNKILDQVVQWNPPTNDHRELKTFMIEQIDTSTKYLNPLPINERPSFSDWQIKKEKTLRDNLTYYTEQRDKEVARIKERREWIEQLMTSLQ